MIYEFSYISIAHTISYIVVLLFRNPFILMYVSLVCIWCVGHFVFLEYLKEQDSLLRLDMCIVY